MEGDGVLLEPGTTAADDHRCVAIAGPRVISHQQQDLLCLLPAHVDCPRYRRATTVSPSPARGPLHRPAFPRATGAALVVLAMSAGISFGFVVQRGGIDLPSASPDAGSSGAAVVPSPSAPAPTATGVPLPSGSASSTAPSQASATPGEPTAAPSIAPTPAATPKPTPTPTPALTPTPRPSASGGPSASRMALLTPCPGQAGCYVYTIRAGDNLTSIANWFGVPIKTVYAWNPWVRTQGIHAGDKLKIPTPTR